MKSFFFTVLFAGIIIGVSIFQNANAIEFDPASIYITDNGKLVPYKLVDNLNTAAISTHDGSISFDKNTCAISFYDVSNTNGSPSTVDSYQVLASQGNTGVWNPVSIINNAACNTSISENQGTVSITGTKSVTGAGVFSVQYTKVPAQPFKLTFSATNNNPSWTNYHIGLRETLQVPQTATLGNQTYDLSQYNNTSLSRTWLSNHSAQLLHLGLHTLYSTGIGWNNVDHITINWIGGKAYLVIDYTFNTPILSPGNTITVDPSIASDALGSKIVASTSTASAQNTTVTIGSNSNRVLVVGISYNEGGTTNTNFRIANVKLSTGQSFTLAKNETVVRAAAVVESSELWYLVAPPTGSVTINIRPQIPGNTYDMVASVYSLYNVKQTSPIGVTNGTTNTNIVARIAITPTTAGSWLIDSVGTLNTLSSPSDTFGWSNNTASGWFGASQYKSNPTIGSKNVLSWNIAGPNPFYYSVIELLATNPPGTPTITHVNTINNTAIKADWPAVSGAAWYWFNATLSGGSTTHINTTSITNTLNNYTAGSKYTFSLVAGNGSGKSSSSITKFNYTKQIAPTSPAISSITSIGARSTWTNPSGNVTAGFLIYQVQGSGSNYTLAGTSSNSTNHFDLTGLSGNTKHTVKISSRYATGTNYTGNSSNSTTVSFYTLPTSPTGLAIAQTRALIANLTWNQPAENGTVLGYKIERSNNGGSSWTTVTANTTNSIKNYNDTVPSAGTYTYRVSTIKYGGTSSPSSTASKSIWQYFTVRAYHNDNTTAVYGSILQSNSSSKNNVFPLVSGSVVIPGISQLNNFSAQNALINFIVGKEYNYNATTNHSLNMSTHDFNVDCPSTGTGADIELWTNETNGHKITTFSTPSCFSNNTVKWSTKFTANGNSLNSFSTNVYAKIINATFLNNATLKYNTTSVTTALSSPYIVSASTVVGTGIQTKLFNWSMNLTVSPAYTPANYTVGHISISGTNKVTIPITFTTTPLNASSTKVTVVGTGIQTKLFNWSMNLTVSPAYTPANFTVGHISISGTNKVTAPITFTTTPLNASATQVTVTFPSTYTMAYQAKLNTEQQVLNYSGLPVVVDTPSLGLSQSTFYIKNPKNDTVTLFARDTLTPNNATLQLNVPVTSIPFVSQIAQFKAGAFGTTAQIGSLDLVTFIVIIIAFIGMNRVNETIGVMMCVMIIAVMSFFGLIAWPTTMVAAIALVVLITITSTKKLPWS